MKKETAIYQSYLLRLWQVEVDGRISWHGSLEKAGSRRQLYFTNVDDLFTFLKVQMQKMDEAMFASDHQQD